MFIAIGDYEYDTAPIQVSQFEANDELMEKWLTKTYLEGGGGPNGHESYTFAYIIATRHTNCDAINLRKQKVLLVTIGDEPTCTEIDKNTLSKHLGDWYQSSILTKDILKEVQNIY